MKKGSVTVYMTWMLAVLLSLFVTVIEGARQRAISIQAETAVDLAVYSVFAEYNQALFDAYDLLFIDTSYGEKTGSLARAKKHFSYYANENLMQGQTAATADLTKCFLSDVSFPAYAYATDQKGAVFEKQAIRYMEQKYGLSYVAELKNELIAAKESGLLTRDVTAERQQNQRIIEETELPKKDTGKVDAEGNPVLEEAELENPADQVNGSRAKGVLLLVTDQKQHISEQSINPAHFSSHREGKQEGIGLTSREQVKTAEKLLFDSYIMEKCSCFPDEEKNAGELSYQLEYILGGKNSDIENLKYVVHRLLLIREVSNVTYLFSDGTKMAEAAAMASAVATAAGVPVLIEPIKISLLFAWAYAEAVYDVRTLLAGGGVSLLKTAQNWHYSLEGMLQYEGDTSVKDTQEKKPGELSYQEYLRLFLAAEGEEKKVLRMMDVVEMHLQTEDASFYLADCVDYISIQAEVGSKYGYSKELERTFYY